MADAATAMDNRIAAHLRYESQAYCSKVLFDIKKELNEQSLCAWLRVPYLLFHGRLLLSEQMHPLRSVPNVRFKAVG